MLFFVIRIQSSKGVFILSPRTKLEKSIADERIILQSWAIKDFSPETPQFVQINKSENKIHLDYVGKLIL